MTVTRNLARYIDHLGINVADMSRKTGIPYQRLYKSVGAKEPSRDLKADELTEICMFLGVNPMDFAKDDDRDAS